MRSPHWYRQNQLVVNLKKTHLMVLGRKHRKEICEAKLVLDNAEIQPVETVTYLGVTLDSQLKWKEHVKKT